MQSLAGAACNRRVQSARLTDDHPLSAAISTVVVGCCLPLALPMATLSLLLLAVACAIGCARLASAPGRVHATSTSTSTSTVGDDASRPASPVSRSKCDGRVTLVAVAANGSAAEQAAATMLAAFLGRLATGGAPTAPALQIVSPAAAAGKPHVAVGRVAAAALGLPSSDLAELGNEGFVLSSNRTAAIRATCAVVLAGAPNSTIAPQYAAQQLLRQLGVRFLAWDELLVPTDRPPLPLDIYTQILGLDLTFVPQFEYRDVDGWSALADPRQAQYMHLNGAAQSAVAAGAGVTAGAAVSPYASPPGFVHT